MFFLQTASLVAVVPVVIGVVSVGVIIVVVVIVCLLIVCKCKQRKNSFGKDKTVAVNEFVFTVAAFHSSC